MCVYVCAMCVMCVCLCVPCVPACASIYDARSNAKRGNFNDAKARGAVEGRAYGFFSILLVLCMLQLDMDMGECDNVVQRFSAEPEAALERTTINPAKSTKLNKLRLPPRELLDTRLKQEQQQHPCQYHFNFIFNSSFFIAHFHFSF